MLLKCFCVICCFVTLDFAFVVSDANTVHEFASLKAALHYDRQLLESEIAKRPHLIMFYAPWYECLGLGSFAYRSTVHVLKFTYSLNKWQYRNCSRKTSFATAVCMKLPINYF